MAANNYVERETRYFIGRLNRDGVEEVLRMERYNELPTAIRDDFNSAKGFVNAQTANQGVTFFNSSEEEKGENRNYWYFLRSVSSIITIPIGENTPQEVIDHFNAKKEALESRNEGTTE